MVFLGCESIANATSGNLTIKENLRIMKKNAEQQNNEDMDLKHDTMEFAETDEEIMEEDDVLDLGEGEISDVELEYLDTEDEAHQNAALKAVVKDRVTDGDFIDADEDWTDDLSNDESI